MQLRRRVNGSRAVGDDGTPGIGRVVPRPPILNLATPRYTLGGGNGQYRRENMRGRRLMAGFRRIGIVLGVILAMPAFFGLWTWVSLGHAPPKYVYLYLALGLGAYLLASSIGWIMAGFRGEEDDG